MEKKIFSKIVLLLIFAASFSAFAYLNTRGRNDSMTYFRHENATDTTKISYNNKKNVSKSDSLRKHGNSDKNSATFVQDVEIMKLLIKIGKESLPVLSLKDYIPFLK